MASDEFLLDRLRNALSNRKVVWTEKKMFGGNCFMVDDKMCFGAYKGGLMARVDPGEADELATRNGAGQMIHGGRPMNGFLFIEPEGYDSDEDLEFWVWKCLEFNPKARASKTRIRRIQGLP